METYKCKHFALSELVNEQTLATHGELLWLLADSRALVILDLLREHYGPAVINTWANPGLIASYGTRTESGLRVPGMKHYRLTSQHSWFRAFDVLFRDYEAAEIREDILGGRVRLPYNVRLEADVSWLHFDVANNVNRVEVFKA